MEDERDILGSFHYEWWESPNVVRHAFVNSRLFQFLSDYFADKDHTHTVSSYTVEGWETTNLTTCNVTFYRQLEMVTCIYHIGTVTFSNTVDHTIVSANNIPTTFRPLQTFYQDVVNYSSTIRNGLITVDTDGSMKIRMGSANTSLNIYGSFTYPTQSYLPE